VLNRRAQDYGIPEETIRRVLKAATTSNYVANPVARQLAGKRSNVVGVLINTASIVDPRLTQKMEILAAARRLRFIVGHAVGDEAQIREYVSDFRARGVDAVIAHHHNRPAPGSFIYEELANIKRVLYFYKPPPVVRDPWFVEPDFREVGRLATHHLVQRGRRRIAITGVSEVTYPVMAPRRLGYEQVLRESGIAVEPALEWMHDEGLSTRWSEPMSESVADAIVEELVVRQRADAIVSTTDLEAIRLIGALRRIGKRVPDDVAVVGTDNLGVGGLISPQVTNIDLRLDALAEATVELLFEMLGDCGDGESRPNRQGDEQSGRGIIVKPQLCVRQSS
jgi:DNA-binding LacI/PurR family transcriptional regulator